MTKEHPLEVLNVALHSIRLPLLDRAELDRRLELARDATNHAIGVAGAARGANDIVPAIAETGELCLALEQAAAAWEVSGNLLLVLANQYAREAKLARGDLARAMHDSGAPAISSRGLLLEPLEPAASVEITGEVPAQFRRVAEAPPDKALILRELRHGKELAWARLAYGPPRVRISAKDPA